MQPSAWRMKADTATDGRGDTKAVVLPSLPGACSIPKLFRSAEQEAWMMTGPVGAAQRSPTKGVPAA